MWLGPYVSEIENDYSLGVNHCFTNNSERIVDPGQGLKYWWFYDDFMMICHFDIFLQVDWESQLHLISSTQMILEVSVQWGKAKGIVSLQSADNFLYLLQWFSFISSVLFCFILTNVAFGKSLCPTLSQLKSMGNTSVEFGYDISSGCILHLNRFVDHFSQKPYVHRLFLTETICS